MVYNEQTTAFGHLTTPSIQFMLARRGWEHSHQFLFV